jgi:hypothetical protein
VEERLRGGANWKRADNGGARMKSDVEEGYPVAGADEADSWAVEKWGRSLSSGATERRTVKGGRTAASDHF